jgi:hypothetical protein
LIGSGYDAYCVYGAAPKYITKRDESQMDCPYPLEVEEAADDMEDPDENEMQEKKPEK